MVNYLGQKGKRNKGLFSTGSNPYFHRIIVNKEIIYDQEFFNTMHDHVSSARVILDILFKHYNPKSVVDVGCGSGSWLKVADEMGVNSLTGIDGKWLKKEN